MEIVYDADENCRNMRKLALAMKPIHQRFGTDFKIGTSARDFTEETHFFDKELYREAYKKSTHDFLINNWDTNVVFYPPTHISDECKKQFAKKVDYYGKNPEEMPEHVEDDVRLQLHRLMKRIDPEMLSKMTSYKPGNKLSREDEIDQAYEIDIKMGDNKRLNEIYLAAFHTSGPFRRMAFAEKDVRNLFSDSADVEKRIILADSFMEQGEKEKTNYVIITADIKHKQKTEEVIDPDKKTDDLIRSGMIRPRHEKIPAQPESMYPSRKDRSFVMYPEDFAASCRAIHDVLVRKVPDKTDAFKAELAALDTAIKEVGSQYMEEGKLNKTYCQMVTSNRYRDWGIGINRY